MSADNSITEWERSKIAVWDYPIMDRFTKVMLATIIHCDSS